MKPILFDKSATTFTTNGLGRLDFISCTVTEERNGIFELEAEISESALHASQLEMGSIIMAPAFPNGNNQAFRVYQITKPLSGKYKVHAEHLSYQLSMIPVMPFEVAASSSACQTVLSRFMSSAVESCPFTFSTDVTTVASYTQTIPASIRSRMGGVEGSVIDQFGGEWEYDNYNVYLRNHRGVTIPTVTLRYGKNITDLTQEQNISNTITGIVPYWIDSEGGDCMYLPEEKIVSPYAANYPFPRTIPMDFSASFEEQPTESQLRTKAQAYVNQSGIGIPVINIKVSFIDLADTEEYKSIAPLQSVKLCDEINVEFEKLGISTTAKVVKTEYNVLSERYDSIEVGSLRANLSTTITDTNANNIKTMTAKFGQISNELQEDIDNATAWLTADGGIIKALKNSNQQWTDLLCCSASATASTGNVLRLNVNGIGFSSTGWNGPFTQAWTLDGRLVIGGTNVPSITVYDNQNNIIFQADATKIIWNAPNSTMAADGTITVYDTSHNIVFQASKNAMIWNAQNSSMNAAGVISMKGAQIEDGDIVMKYLEGYDEDDNPMYDTLVLSSSDVKLKSQAVINYFGGQTIEISKGEITGYSSQYPSRKAHINFYSNSSESIIDFTTDRLVMNNRYAYTGQITVAGGATKNVVNGIILA
jgi:phage minor structural protein